MKNKMEKFCTMKCASIVDRLVPLVDGSLIDSLALQLQQNVAVDVTESRNCISLLLVREKHSFELLLLFLVGDTSHFELVELVTHRPSVH